MEHKKLSLLILFVALLLPAKAFAQASQFLNTTSATPVGTWNYSGANVEQMNSTTLPATCTVGEWYQDTDATSGQQIYACESADTWKLQGDGANPFGSTIDDSELTSEDFGDISCDGTEDGCTLDSGSVASAEIVDDSIDSVDLNTTNGATDEQCLTWENSTQEFEWQNCAAGAGDITAVGDCTTNAAFTGACGTLLQSNTDIIIELDNDNNGSESFQIKDGADAIVCEVTEAGALQLDSNITIGANADVDYTLTFDGDTSNGVLNYDEDNADFEFDQDVASTGTVEGATITEGGVAVHNNDEMDASSELAAIIDDEVGTGQIVFQTNPTLNYPDVTGKVDRNDVAVNDDDCTGEQGLWWYDTTDSAFEFCKNNSGIPSTLGSGGGGAAGALHINLLPQQAKITGDFIDTTTGFDAAAGAQISGGDTWKLLFDASTDEAAMWQVRLPASYASDPILGLQYSLASATSGSVQWEASIMCLSSGDSADADSPDYATLTVQAAEGVPGTAGYIDSVSITLTDDASPGACAAGDMAWIYLSTDADDAINDDATGDREVLSAQLTFTGT
jgi:hypothetical protein